MAGREELENIELSPESRAAAEADCASTFDLSVCGRCLRLRTNEPARLEGFLRAYEAFRRPPDPTRPAELEIAVRRTERPEPAVLFLARDRAYRTTEPALAADPEPVIEHLVVAHLRSHYLVHAGGVARDGRGIVIAAGSHMGKTTLTAFLVSRGWHYLSDEIAPISRTDGTLSPYPLALGIRAGPATALVADLPGRDFVHGSDRKKLVTARDFTAGVARDPVPLHAVVFITPRVTDGVRTARRFDGLATALFNGMTPAFRAALLERTRSEAVSEHSIGDALHSLTLRSRTPESFLDALRATAREHGIGLVMLQIEDHDPKDFDAEPRLLKLPVAAGLIELVKKIPSSQKAELVRTQFDGRLPGLVEELSRRAGHAAFYKLSPGRLDAMVRAIESLP